MFASRRSARLRLSLPSVLPARTAIAGQRSCINVQDFHSSPKQAGSRATWMPMRVKTPWIDALSMRREAEKIDPQSSGQQTIKRDLTPKKMSDSFYSAVCIPYSSLLLGKRKPFCRLSDFHIDSPSGTGQMASGLISERRWAHQVSLLFSDLEIYH